MFDEAVVNEGLGQAEAAHTRSSPDGLGAAQGMGAYVQPAPGDSGYPYPQPTDSSPYPGQYSATHGQIDFIEPEDTSSGSATRSAGFTLLFVALGTGLGYAWKGGLGACTGLLVTAGLANVYRAQKWFDSPEPSEKHEAIVSALLGVGELGSSCYVGWKAYQHGEAGLKI